MAFPVCHSTLDSGALLREVTRRYTLDHLTSCRLIARGSNDYYRIECRDTRYVLRVARANFRSAAEARYELEMLAYLAEHELAAACPVALAEDEFFFSVDAPEGQRHIALFEWIDGVALGAGLSAPDARAAGRLLARLHEALQGFASPTPKMIDTAERITRQSPFLERLLGEGTQARALYCRALAALERWLSQSDAAELPRGPTHGDFQYANLMRDARGELTAIDFDDCGVDWLVKDLVTFFWRARFEGLPEDRDREFLAGYESLRPLAADERAALPMLLVARDLYLLASYAAYIDRIGPVPGFESEQRFVQALQRDLQQAGID